MTPAVAARAPLSNDHESALVKRIARDFRIAVIVEPCRNADRYWLASIVLLDFDHSEAGRDLVSHFLATGGPSLRV
ncbi:hypothetical protein [Paraburkholderia sacchari]|uniref:hypothetical protein n=1 Tax=Paraburkholderia sacchari TaxID=159450 RepID=UPI000541CE23|nr:hypothetical protein [Paraburkholderia sacchari]NLP64739.1 hypothetical protein [Paraburkholderia sacchari]